MNAIKKGVSLYGLRPEMSVADRIISRILNSHGYACVITSAFRPGDKKLHGAGLAIDYRTKHISLAHVKHDIVRECQQALPGYDVFIHYEGKRSEHMHCEHDPKTEEFARDKKYYKATGVWPA